MKKAAFGSVVVVTAGLLISQPQAYGSWLSHTGNALTYPVKKAARNGEHNVGHTSKALAYPVRKDAGNGSKDFNHTGNKIQYPVRKAGENTSKAAHKAGVK